MVWGCRSRRSRRCWRGSGWKLSRLEPAEPANRYERARPGELIDVDVERLGVIAGAGHRVTGQRRSQLANRRARRRGAPEGWERVRVCVETPHAWPTSKCCPTSRAYRRGLSASRGRVLPPLRDHRRARDERQRRLLSLDDPRLRLPRSASSTCALPYRPRTNGKAERFIRTLLGGWAYGAIYGSSRERTAALDGWLRTYNHRRPHGSLSHKSPIARLDELNNLARSTL